MMSESNDLSTKQMFNHLDYTYNEFVKPAWENWLRLESNNYTIAAFDLWTNELFTEKSRVQIVTKGAAVNFVDQEINYCLTLCYVDGDKHMRVAKPFYWVYKYKA